MLNDIRLHLDSDEDAQNKAEEALSGLINTLQLKNVNAFQHYVPSVGKVIPQIPFEHLSVFVDKQKQLNIVDFNTGTTLYTPDVDNNIKAQVNTWAFNSALLDLAVPQRAPTLINNTQQICDFTCRQAYAIALQEACNTIPIDSLVILGLGKAEHISHLLAPLFKSCDVSSTKADEGHLASHLEDNALASAQVKNLVIYEPNWEIFRCSLSVFDWSNFLIKAEQVGLQVFFQLGTNLCNIYDEISELHQQLNASRILFYKHINSPLFMHLTSSIAKGHWGQSSAQLPSVNQSHHFHHLHPFSATHAHRYENVTSADARFCSNMALFAEYFPDIHASFSYYQPQCWQTLKDSHSGAINLVNTHYGNFFSNTGPQEEGESLAHHFSQHPHVDGLVFGYEGDKLRHYLHNTFIRQADMILRTNEESQAELPSEVKVLMLFGLGSGYMLEALYKNDSEHGIHNINNLIICEPNPDLFYASLHAIDWSPIFARVNEGKHKLYINIGESSSLLFRDVMSQFLALGPHLLNETYITQAYHNPMLNNVLGEVRQQLKVIFAMGENFDHVAYGIAHTVSAMRNNIPALRYNPSQYLTHLNKQTPVFIVGNGPSLDNSIALIKEHQGNAIVVSCGTALQALYKNGITPDFHGEVEQNRANFDWASRINDARYLKKITLLSVNGIHPDTSKLYKNVLMAFKSGESSTHTMLAMFPDKTFHPLQNAYPTVTNMAMSFFLAMGFEQLYLVGVDLGFADQSKHHSRASGYYENGKQIYDYQSAHNADLRVKGNRQEWVFTKTEFNISRMIIEQMLQDVHTEHHIQEVITNGNKECFNLSDGVYIEGTLPLDPESVLVMTSSQQKQDTMITLRNCFMTAPNNVIDMLNSGYQAQRLANQLGTLKSICRIDIASKDDINDTIEGLSDLLKEARAQGKSLFYYYFFNSINYLNAALSKAGLQSNDALASCAAARLLAHWNVLLCDASQMLKHQFSLIDSADAFGDKREKYLLKTCSPVHFLCGNKDTLSALRIYLTSEQWTLVIDDKNDNGDVICTSHSATSTHKSPLIIVVECYNDIERYMPIVAARITKDAPMGLLFHDYALLRIFEKEYPEVAVKICLLYGSPYLALNDSESTEVAQNASASFDTVLQSVGEKVNQGRQDVLLIDEYWHLIQTRGQDLQLYSHIIAKPRFTAAGLMPNKKAKSTKNVLNNEYDSISVATIKETIIDHFNANTTGYMFKNYFATPKNRQNNAGSVSIVDALQNRGSYLHRAPLDFEMLGNWQLAIS